MNGENIDVDQAPATERAAYSTFWPLTLVAISIALILLWGLRDARQLRRSNEQLRQQQAELVERSQQLQVGLEKLARELLDLAQTDEDAKALVAKYNISVSNTTPAVAPPAAALSDSSE